MAKLNWEIVHECDDEQGNPTQWVADVTDSKYRKFLCIIFDLDGYFYVIDSRKVFSDVAKCKSLTSAKRCAARHLIKTKGMYKMSQTIKITSAEKELINDLLNLGGKEILEKYGYKRDETITHTAKFLGGIEADIKLTICEEESPYMEGVLLCDGIELMCTEPSTTYDREWIFEYNGVTYTVVLEVENNG